RGRSRGLGVAGGRRRLLASLVFGCPSSATVDEERKNGQGNEGEWFDRHYSWLLGIEVDVGPSGFKATGSLPRGGALSRFLLFLLGLGLATRFHDGLLPGRRE